MALAVAVSDPMLWRACRRGHGWAGERAAVGQITPKSVEHRRFGVLQPHCENGIFDSRDRS